ncbi:hypothetical protein PHLGIDRAFT_17869 [Phlebiopsis gigantea 11061_1 CR5-6]|uniref:RING-type domain-containing protein n=1 Tax=Phlebiopsis gigantea (strain 11061_1 CR5-6) TaxID=745531 RepID=A0A0C3PVL2_PHLG1|nr:hypothetical protein PHLGIDRAFT_17869 [Phlebiopsis gigantea 11061_1 CR5-6]
MSEIDTVGDFITVDVDRDDQSVSGLQDTVEGHGAFRTTSVSESTEEESHLSSSSSGDEASERGREPNKDQARKGLQPDTKPYRTTHTPSEAVSQGERSSVHPLTAAWICKVCNDVPASPMITMCGHVFCRKCILAEICENLRCPACKYPVLVEIKL